MINWYVKHDIYIYIYLYIYIYIYIYQYVINVTTVWLKIIGYMFNSFMLSTQLYKKSGEIMLLIHFPSLHIRNVYSRIFSVIAK